VVLLTPGKLFSGNPQMYQVNCFLETIKVPGKLFSVNPQKYQVNCFLGNTQKYQVNSFLETLKILVLLRVSRKQFIWYF
jgi:hypothetical protein